MGKNVQREPNIDKQIKIQPIPWELNQRSAWSDFFKKNDFRQPCSKIVFGSEMNRLDLIWIWSIYAAQLLTNEVTFEMQTCPLVLNARAHATVTQYLVYTLF